MKLYRVDVRFSYYVVAESEQEALDAADEVVRDGGPPECAECQEVSSKYELYADGWDPHCLVYGVDVDLPLGVAFDRYASRSPEEAP